jgi:superfamily II DNA/RNA helicase
MDQFRTLEAGVLVCTDVAARGINVVDIDLVISFDAPMRLDTYTHRAGRAGRFGARGLVITLLCNPDELRRLIRFDSTTS